LSSLCVLSSATRTNVAGEREKTGGTWRKKQAGGEPRGTKLQVAVPTRMMPKAVAVEITKPIGKCLLKGSRASRGRDKMPEAEAEAEVVRPMDQFLGTATSKGTMI